MGHDNLVMTDGTLINRFLKGVFCYFGLERHMGVQLNPLPRFFGLSGEARQLVSATATTESSTPEKYCPHGL